MVVREDVTGEIDTDVRRVMDLDPVFTAAEFIAAHAFAALIRHLVQSNGRCRRPRRGLSRRRSSRRGLASRNERVALGAVFDPEHHLVGFAYDPEATIRRVPRNAFGLLYIVRPFFIPRLVSCAFDERDAGEIGHGHIGAIERHNA